MNTLRTTALFAISVFTATLTASAQTPLPEAAQAAAAITSQQLTTLRNAHTLFLSNAGTDTNFTSDQPAGATGPYNQVYARLALWGRFQLADSPAKADVVLEVHAANRDDFTGGTETDKHGNSYISGTTYQSPSLDLTLRNRSTNATLWTTNLPCTWGSSKKSSIKYFATCSDQIVQAFQQLTVAADASSAAPATTNATAATLPPSNTVALAPAAPIPTPLRAFSKLFIAPPITDDDTVTAAIDDLNIRFQTDLANCCGFTLVSDPSQADIVAALHGFTEIHRDTTDGETTYPQLSEFDLDLFDPSTHVLLWSINNQQATNLGVGWSGVRTNDQGLQNGIDKLIPSLRQFGIPNKAIETTLSLRQSKPKDPLPPNSQAAAARAALQAAHTVFLNYITPVPDTVPVLAPTATGFAFQYLTSAMKSWNHYTLTTDKQQADLIFNFETINATTPASSKPIVFQQLTVIDPKTQQSLWTATTNADPGTVPFTSDLSTISVQNCISELKLLDGTLLTSDEKKKLTVPNPPSPYNDTPSFKQVLGALL